MKNNLFALLFLLLKNLQYLFTLPERYKFYFYLLPISTTTTILHKPYSAVKIVVMYIIGTVQHCLKLLVDTNLATIHTCKILQ